MSVLIFACKNCSGTIAIKYLQCGDICQCKHCGISQEIPHNAAVTGDFPDAPPVQKAIAQAEVEDNKTRPLSRIGFLRRNWFLPATPVLTKAYCLYCYASMQANAKICSACGATNLTADRLRYWTREKKLVRIEQALKMAIVALCAGLCLALAFLFTHMGGTGAGWFIALPVFFGMALWWTASCLTRRVTTFRPSIFWGAFVLIAAILVLPGVLAAVLTREIFPYALLIPAAMLGLSYLLFISGRLFSRWKKNRIERMQCWLHGNPRE